MCEAGSTETRNMSAATAEGTPYHFGSGREERHLTWKEMAVDSKTERCR
jgi:hypothetical protein